jgi:hypothetical protein
MTGLDVLGEVVEERARLAPLSAAGLDANAPCEPREIIVINRGSGDFEIRFCCGGCFALAGPVFHEAPLGNKASMLVAWQDALSDFEREALAKCPKLAG